jgi:hypothetical protein
MRWTLFFVIVTLLKAQESPAVASARREMERVRYLIKSGALPPAKIQEAQQNLDDVLDEAIVEKNADPHETLAAAQRRVDRQQEKVNRFNELIARELAIPADGAALEKELETRQEILKQIEAGSEILSEISAMAHAEISHPMEEKTEGTRFIQPEELKNLTLAFEKKFSEHFPVSAKGMTEVHRSLGFDHTGRVDVAVNPDSPEGIWLREYLDERTIPYYAFRGAIAGKATAAHIHIGPGSTKL